MTTTISRTKRRAGDDARPRLVRSRGATPRFIFLGLPDSWRRPFSKLEYVACKKPTEMSDAAMRANKDTIWVASRSEATDQLVRALARLASAHAGQNLRFGRLLLLSAPRPIVLPILQAYFDSVVGAASSFRFLPPDQLAETLSVPEEEARNLFIGGVVDAKSASVVLVRGDLDRIVAPLSIFPPSGTAKPNVRKVEFDDYGQTIRFGRYEAGADFVLYTLDPEYRKQVNTRRRAQEKGFGPSLRRLRMLRKIGRDQFNGIAAKTIARIERGEVQTPRGKTLRTICNVLGVEPDRIETY